MENVDGKLFVGSVDGETIVEVGQAAEHAETVGDSKEIGRGFTQPIFEVYVDNTNEDYPLNVRVEDNGEIIEELSASTENDIRVLFGIFFCPREVCSINPQTGVEEKTYTIDMDLEEGETTGLCFEIFTKLFEKLKDNNLVAEYYLNEIECYIEASHPDHRVLERISPLINLTHFGLGFWMGNVPNNRQVTRDEFNFLVEVQVILNELKNEFPILKNEELKMQYHVECKFNN